MTCTNTDLLTMQPWPVKLIRAVIVTLFLSAGHASAAQNGLTQGVVPHTMMPVAANSGLVNNQDWIPNTQEEISKQARNGRWLQKEINKARKGDVISIPEGVYNVQDLKIYKTLKLIGEGEVVLQSINTVAKGLLVPDLGVSLQVENITFRGARSRDRNGAGIRHDGKNLWVINCIFESNEDGILATGSENGRIEIRNSTFLNNGNGDGFSHAIYLSSGEQLLVYDSRFIGTKIGHHIKSLAEVTAVTDSYFDDAGAGTSYTLDVTRGGIASITGSFILQRATAENATIVNFDASRGGEAISIRIAGNQIINRHPSGNLVRNPTAIKTVMEDNQISNEGTGRLKIAR